MAASKLRQRRTRLEQTLDSSEAAGEWQIVVLSLQKMSSVHRRGLSPHHFVRYRDAVIQWLKGLREEHRRLSRRCADLKDSRRRLRKPSAVREPNAEIVREIEAACCEINEFLELSELARTSRKSSSWERRLAITRLMCELAVYRWEVAVPGKKRELEGECEGKVGSAYNLAQVVLHPAHPTRLALAQDVARWKLRLCTDEGMVTAGRVLREAQRTARQYINQQFTCPWLPEDTGDVIERLREAIQVWVNALEPGLESGERERLRRKAESASRRADLVLPDVRDALNATHIQKAVGTHAQASRQTLDEYDQDYHGYKQNKRRVAVKGAEEVEEVVVMDGRKEKKTSKSDNQECNRGGQHAEKEEINKPLDTKDETAQALSSWHEVGHRRGAVQEKRSSDIREKMAMQVGNQQKIQNELKGRAAPGNTSFENDIGAISMEGEQNGGIAMKEIKQNPGTPDDDGVKDRVRQSKELEKEGEMVGTNVKEDCCRGNKHLASEQKTQLPMDNSKKMENMQGGQVSSLGTKRKKKRTIVSHV